MYAIAEVYETDVNKLRVGQRATIESEQIGLQIKKQGILLLTAFYILKMVN